MMVNSSFLTVFVCLLQCAVEYLVVTLKLGNVDIKSADTHCLKFIFQDDFAGLQLAGNFRKALHSS